MKKRQISPGGYFSISRSDMLAGAAAVLVALLCIAPSLGGEFLNWDDDRFIVNNAHVAGLTAENLSDAFSGLRFESYQPLHLISYMVDGALWPGRAPLYRLHNLLLYCAGTVLLFMLFRRTGFSTRPALVGTLLFAAAPYHVESVAWITSRKDVLMLVWLLVAWHLHLLADDRARRKVWVYGLAVTAYGFALLSKSSAAVFPAFVFFLDWGVRGRSLRRATVAAARFAPFALAAGGVLPFIWHEAALVQPSVGNGAERFLLAAWTGAHYGTTALFPFHLSPLYAEPTAEALRRGAVLFCGAVLLLGAAVYTAHRRGRAVKPVAACVGIFAAGLVPFFNFIPLYYLRADRYLLLPSVGLALAAALLVRRAAEQRPVGPRIFAALLWGIVAVWAGTSALESIYWRDSLSLWQHAVKREPEAYFARLKLGETLRNAERPGESARQYRAALRIRPLSPTAWGGLFWGALLEDMAEANDTDAAAAEKLAYAFVASANDGPRLEQLRAFLSRNGRRRAARVVDTRLSQ